MAFKRILLIIIAALAITVAAAPQPRFDVVIAGGTVYDGTGAPGIRADVGISGDRVSEVAASIDRGAARELIDASGLAVAPGFINMLSWATESLIQDGRSQSDIRQGVTTEIFGEGSSMGPVTEEMRARWKREQGAIKYDIPWTTLAEYLQFLERKGVSPNVASFVGAATIREHVIGLEDRKPTAAELARMQDLVRQSMADGALGVGSSLIYAPGFYASTEELIALAKAAGEFRGKYISHLRSEGNRLEEAVTELIRISREAGVPAEIYHLKAAGQRNWTKMSRVLEMIEAARAAGLKITADMYMYTAGATGLDAALPPSALSGGWDALFARLRTPAERARIRAAIVTPTDAWENLYLAAGSAERVLLVEFKNEKLRHLTGRTLASVAAERKQAPEDTILDLILEDQSRVGTVYFLMSDDNIRTQLKKPWVSVGSDGGSLAPEGVFLSSNPHPRAYGNVARLLGKYVREDKVITLQDAIRRLSGLPAENLGLDRRGLLKQGYFADVVVFDPGTIADRATFEKPHQYAAGMKHVLVNGQIVLKDGEHTGATPGRALKGPGAVQTRAAGQPSDDDRWIATWGASQTLMHVPPASPPPAAAPAAPVPAPVTSGPARRFPVPRPLPSFNDQTIRMVARVSLGGRSIRVRLSNAFGAATVRIGAARIARARSGGAIDPSTSRQLTFGGQTAAAIYAGQILISDPVDLVTPPLGDLAVSLFLPAETPASTTHRFGLRTMYVARGDATNAADMSSETTTESYYWLAGIDVLAPAKARTIVTFGDSITDGDQSTPGAIGSWPALLAARLQGDPATAHLAVVNAGISGNRLLGDNGSGIARIVNDAISQPGVAWITLLEGINDITAATRGRGATSFSEKDLIAAYRQVIAQAHLRGIRVAGCTITPFGGSNVFTEEGERIRSAVNDWIRTSGAFDAVIDFDRAVRDPKDPARIRAEADSPDLLHPGDAGYRLMAAAIDPRVFLRR